MSETTEHLDQALVTELKALMGSGYGSLLDTFVRDSEMRIEVMRQALVEEDAETLRYTAHSFKGSAGNMGAPRLSALCRRMEKLGRNTELAQGEALLPVLEQEYRKVLELLNQRLWS